MNLHSSLALSEDTYDRKDEIQRIVQAGIEQASIPIPKYPILLNMTQAALALVHGGSGGVITEAEFNAFHAALCRFIEGYKSKTTPTEVGLRLRRELERLA